MTKQNLKIIFLIIIFFLLPDFVLAVPTINNISGAFIHGQNITVSGSEFGTKAQSAPFIWDNCSGDSPLDKWDFAYPYTNDANYRLDYRAPSEITKDGEMGGVELPHQHVTKYLAGAHYNSGVVDAHSGGNVCAGKNNQQGEEYSYISYYYRIDPDWYYVGSPNDHNFKEYDYAAGGGYMGDGRNLYFGLSDLDGAQGLLGPNYIEGMNIDMTDLTVNRDLVTYYDEYEMPLTPTYMVFPRVYAINPNQGWQKMEFVMKHNSVDGFHKVYRNNQLVWEVYLDDDNVDDRVERSETVFGGYAREAGSDIRYKNNWRYYSDIYYDHSLSRVMLANNQVYNQATIIEPQIINSWSSSSISFDLNLGRLSEFSTLYLFIIDSTGVVNVSGYPIVINSSDSTAPNAPTGLGVI